MFFDGGGVTFTGGEVSLQADAVSKLCEMLKKENISTCIETNASLKDTEKLIDVVDYMIADFKSPSKEILKTVTGADIKIIKENLLKRAVTKKYLLIRIPLINNFNTGEENAREFASFFKELTEKSKSDNIFIEILTYHEYGKDKYKNENLEYNFSDGFVTQSQVDILKTELEKNNLKIIKT
jgi:pyruvate formate lyase activating enzyme